MSHSEVFRDWIYLMKNEKMIITVLCMMLMTSYIVFADDSIVHSTIKRWNRSTNPQWCNERKQSDIHIIKKYYENLLSKNTNSIKNVINSVHNDSLTIVTLYDQLLRTKITPSLLHSHQRNEAINNTLQIVLQLGLPDDIITPDWVRLVGDSNIHIALEYYYDGYCNEANKELQRKLGKISFIYSILDKKVHIIADDSNIHTVIKRWNKSINPNWCNERKQSDADIVKNYYDRVISHTSNEKTTYVSHHDSKESMRLYEQLLSQKIDSSLLSMIQRKELLQNTAHIISQLGLPDNINDVHFTLIGNKDENDLISISYYFDGYCDEEKTKYQRKYGEISFLYSLVNKKVVKILLLTID